MDEGSEADVFPGLGAPNLRYTHICVVYIYIQTYTYMNSMHMFSAPASYIYTHTYTRFSVKRIKTLYALKIGDIHTYMCVCQLI